MMNYKMMLLFALLAFFCGCDYDYADEKDQCKDCKDRECGDDGCGGSCGGCAENFFCNADYVCEFGSPSKELSSGESSLCEKDCENFECGPDPICGEICGFCADNEYCLNGVCKCVPDCYGKECGDDGCGGTCNICDDEWPQNYCLDNTFLREYFGSPVCVQDQCVYEHKDSECEFDCDAYNKICNSCAPDCSDKECGDDGCGGTCGECPLDSECQMGICGCVPSCVDKECGDDGCGGTCGECERWEYCVSGFCRLCPEGWRAASDGTHDSCYTLVRSKLTYNEAKTYCNNQYDSHLATIFSSSENSFVGALNTDNETLWIGLDDTSVEGTFKWVTGESLEYTNWASGEPNDQFGEDCVHFATVLSQWYDTNCENLSNFVCEFEF